MTPRRAVQFRIPVPPSVLDRMPLFDGFPYLTTRCIPSAFHLLLLAEWPRAELVHALRRQVVANQLPTALVLSRREAFFMDPGGEPVASNAAPRSTVVFAWGLHPAVPFDERDLGDRPARLRTFVERVNPRGGYLLGDIRLGGRPATPAELLELCGHQDDGTPRGLERCLRCGDRRGACLQDVPDEGVHLVSAHCRCDNTTCCARCGRPFRERRVGGNEYDPKQRRVLHWPGFMALDHRCPDGVRPSGEPDRPRHRRRSAS